MSLLAVHRADDERKDDGHAGPERDVPEHAGAHQVEVAFEVVEEIVEQLPRGLRVG
jgi:hypothetical protein